MPRKFILVTRDWSGMGFALDERNKGDTVIVAVNPDYEKLEKDGELDKFNNIGEGLVKRFDLEDVMKNRAKFKDWYWVWDGNHSVDENELLRKEGFKVANGGKLSFQMENDREYGIELAEKTFGIESPLWDEFEDNKEAIEMLKADPEHSYFLKPNAADESHLTTPPASKDPKLANKYLQEQLEITTFKEGFVLQRTVPGTEVNLEFFCVNGEVKSAQINLEIKRISEASLIDGYEKGSLCGCALDVCKDIPLDNELVEATIGKMKGFIKEKNYTGFADMNFIIGEEDIWFIEWCWRPGYNAHPGYFMNVSNKSFLDTMADMVDGTYEPDVKRGWGATVTMYTDHPAEGTPIMIAPEVKKKTYLFDGMQKDKSIITTGISNELLIVGGYGNSIEKALMDAYDNVAKVVISKSDYRSDGLKDGCNSSPVGRWKQLNDLGYV